MNSKSLQIWQILIQLYQYFICEWLIPEFIERIVGVNFRKANFFQLFIFYKKPTLNEVFDKLKIKGWRKTYHDNTSQKKAGVVTLISDKTNFLSNWNNQFVIPLHTSHRRLKSKNLTIQMLEKMKNNRNSQCWWECKMTQSLGKTVWQFLTQLTLLLSSNPAIAFLGIYPYGLKTCIHQKLVPKCLWQHYSYSPKSESN